ncbi:MAG: FixH family protein [Phycisphaerales bacterium]|nr:hypothetical protein [Chloroflexota bacterium]MBY0307542.1 FixH family protein [Phycisphaerales bacterium]
MKTAKRSILFALFTAGAALAFGTPAALAQHDHGKPDDHAKQPGHGAGAAGGQPHEHGPAAKAPETYKDAVKQIHDRLEEVGAAIEKGDMDAAHDEADAAGTIGKALGALALKADSGVPKDKVKEVNTAGKEIAAQADALHEGVEKKDKAAVQAAYARMNKALESLAQFVSAQYVCPMHCEGSKTYGAPGKCPVCKMDLKKVTTDKYSVEVKPLGGKVEAGKPTTLVFTIKDPAGAVCKDFQTVHEKKLHLLMTSKDLSWFAHEHPELQPDGTFVFKDFAFPAAGEYVLWHDCTPTGVGMQVVPVTFTVPGTAPAAKPLAVDAGKPKTIDGYSYTFASKAPLATGENEITFTVSKDGKPVTDLEPLLGAMGHLVIISSDQKNFVHSHPHEANESDANRRGGPAVTFEAWFEKPGTYKGWGQFQHKGKMITAPFTFEVAKGDASKMGKPHSHDAHGDDHGKKPDHDHGK